MEDGPGFAYTGASLRGTRESTESGFRAFLRPKYPGRRIGSIRGSRREWPRPSTGLGPRSSLAHLVGAESAMSTASEEIYSPRPGGRDRQRDGDLQRRGEAGCRRPGVSRLPDRGPRRGGLVPGGRLPAAPRRPAQGGRPRRFESRIKAAEALPEPLVGSAPTDPGDQSPDGRPPDLGERPGPLRPRGQRLAHRPRGQRPQGRADARPDADGRGRPRADRQGAGAPRALARISTSRPTSSTWSTASPLPRRCARRSTSRWSSTPSTS